MCIRLIIVSLFCLVYSFAQAQDKRLVQFSGIITTPDSNTFVPYVTITNKTAHNQAYIANYKGYFSFVANENDTLVFSAVGYQSILITIPPNLADQRYTLMVKMKQIVINLPAVRVYPWASTDEFKKEFMTMKVADDDLAIAKKNLTKKGLAPSYTSVPRDGQEITSASFQNYHNSLENKNINQNYANPLLNPFAWKSFLEQIFQGDRSNNKN
ncbi:MAG: hypothetical protein E6Q66_06680 [Pedobacter sp.]|nr:MAG: hypothetical protein E6Q66_06680 [Pedobacter sp.]